MVKPITRQTPLTYRDLTEVEHVARVALRRAGVILRSGFRQPQVRIKERRGEANYRDDVVTTADLAAEKAIVQVLAHSGLPASIRGEEHERLIKRSPFTWVVDPLDGTANFVAGIPYFSISLALVEHGRLAAGFVFDPLRNELFSALAGSGVQINGRPAHRAEARRLPLVLFGLGLKKDEAASALRTAEWFVKVGAGGLRMLGSAALDLAAVATGRADIFFHRQVNAWDVAAGTLLVRESGGIVLLRRPGQLSNERMDIDLSTPFRGTVVAYRSSVSSQKVRGILSGGRYV